MIGLRAGAGRGTSALVAEDFQHVDGGVVLSERSTDLSALDDVAKAQEHLTGDGDAFGTSFFGVCGFGHAPHDFVGHGDAQFVLHEFRVAQAGEWPDSGYDRNTNMLNVTEKCFEQLYVEDRLCDNVLGTS